MPGCGVNSGNAAKILQATGANEIHASARKSVGSGMIFRHSGVSMGNPDSDEYARKETDVNEVRAITNSIQ
jgi:copper homeostasis protein